MEVASNDPAYEMLVRSESNESSNTITVEQNKQFMNEDTAQWQAMMEATENDHAHRYYIESSLDGSFYGVKRVVQIGSQITIHRVGEENSRKSVKTFLDDVELQELGDLLATGDIIRAKLHCQLELLKSDQDVEVFINFESKSPGDLVLHYIELCNRIPTGSGGTGDYVIYGTSKPQQFISTMHEDSAIYTGPYGDAVGIDHYAISASGSYVATLTFTKRYAHIDLWDMKTSSARTSMASPLGLSSRPQCLSIPYATISIELPGPRTDSCSYFIGVSYNGSHISICPTNGSEHAIPFSMYECAPIAPIDVDTTQPWRLQRAPVVELLDGHYGYGAFHCIDFRDPREENELFVACDGTSACVFSTSTPWTLMHVIKLQLSRPLDQTLALLSDTRTHIFIWPGAMDSFSFYRIQDGARRGGFNLPEQNPEDYNISLALDSTTVAIGRRTSVEIYYAPTARTTGTFRVKNVIISDVVFEQDYFLVTTTPFVPVGGERCCTLKVVNARDMSEVGTISFPQYYKMLVSPYGRDVLLGYRQGSTLNFIRHDNVIPTTIDTHCRGACDLQALHLEELPVDSVVKRELESGSKFEVKYITRPMDKSYRKVVEINVFNQDTGKLVNMSLGSNVHAFRCYILQDPAQLLLFTMDGFLVWNIPSTETDSFELSVAWDFIFDPTDKNKFRTWDVKKATFCASCRKMVVDYIPHSQEGVAGPTTSTKELLAGKDLYIPRSAKETFDFVTKYPEYIYDISSGARRLYISGDSSCEEAIIRHLKVLVQPTSSITLFCIHLLCDKWPAEGYSLLEDVMQKLLSRDTATWVPPSRLPIQVNPLMALLDRAKTQPTLIHIIRIILDYCISHAIAEHELDFLSPVLPCLKDLKNLYPEETARTLGRIAFIPVGAQSHIIHNHLVAHPPQFRWKFWRRNNRPWYKMADPILQFHPNPAPPDPQNYDPTKRIFMTSFDALWCYLAAPSNSDEEDMELPMSWRNTVFKVIKLKLLFKTRLYVECNDFSLEYFDNPAIAALVAYKWHKYNILDILAFAFPLGASIYQMVLILANYDYGLAWPLSFSVLIVFMHMLFELRINKSVGKYITIIQQAFLEIKIFFVIFAAVVLVFTLALLHVIHACPVGECQQSSQFPKHFLDALVTIYFFLGGRYDPVDDDFNNGSWAFKTMVSIYLFFTVILLLNVLIALINRAFAKGDDGWRLAWVENRLRYIESAENMSYNISGYREKYNYFPKRIYFTATQEAADEYQKKFKARFGDTSDKPKVETKTEFPLAAIETLVKKQSDQENLLQQALQQQQSLQQMLQQQQNLLHQALRYHLLQQHQSQHGETPFQYQQPQFQDQDHQPQPDLENLNQMDTGNAMTSAIRVPSVEAALCQDNMGANHQNAGTPQ
ncbi:hypothetical protein BGZ50_007770 [Haplosporangium sp. Z 11]|nr:hypothetical protein BGZ50_007770 [Haplosporangium sp. Z 11]